MQTEIDVLVVGAGPAGLATALGLAQSGIDFRIVDALGEAQNTSRAAVIHAATLETLSRLGVGEKLIQQGLRVPDFRVRERDRILLEADFRRLGGPTPFALMIPQDETEVILVDALAANGHRVEREQRVLAAERTSGGARVTLSRHGGEETILARFVVGADGEKSTIRAVADINFPGSSYGSFLLADVRMDWPLPLTEVSLFFDRGGTLVVAPMSGDRFRVVAQEPNAPAHPTVADVQRLVDERGPSHGTQVRDVIWGSRFQVHHKLADRFHDGPFLLVGDAAHVHSPAGGQGMNLGLRDAEALAHAIAATVAGNGDEPLRRYASERRAAASMVLDRTDRLTRLATTRSTALRWVRNGALLTLGRAAPVRDRIARMLAGFA